MLTGKPPFQSSTTDEIYRRARERDYEWPEDNKFISLEAKDIVANLLQEADRRPQPDDIVQHEWFTVGYMPVAADMSSRLRELPPENPAFYHDHIDPADQRQTIHNHHDLCLQCQVGPWNGTPSSHISTWREVAAEEKAGLTPMIPLAEGVVYRPFNEWVIEQKRVKEQRFASRAAAPTNSQSSQPCEAGEESEAVLAMKQTGLMRAPPQSYAAQQRAQHKPIRTMDTVVRPKSATSSSGQAAPPKTGTMRSRARKDTSSSSAAINPRYIETVQDVNRGAGSVVPTATAATAPRPMQNAPKTLRQNIMGYRHVEGPLRQLIPRSSRTVSSDGEPAETIAAPAKRSLSSLGPSLEVTTIFGPDESLDRIPQTHPDSILSRLKQLQSELDRVLNSRSMAFVSARAAPPSLPRIVIKWIDYSNKLGHGYILNDGTIGALVKSLPTADPVPNPTQKIIPPVCLVVHNAETHLLRRIQDPTYLDRHQVVPQNEDVHFFELQGERGIARVRIPARNYWTSEADGKAGRLEKGRDIYDFRKRDRLVSWRKFANYMMQYGRDGSGKDDPKILPIGIDPSLPPNDVVILYQRFGDVGCWVFCDGHMQFNFPDHTKLVLDTTGTHCHFWHLPVEAAELLNKTGQLDTVALDSRAVLSYPLQTMLNMNRASSSAPATSRSGRTRPEISPEIRVIPEANDFRRKVEFVRQVVREWVSKGGIGNARMDRDHRIRWLGARETFGITAPQKHVWVSIGARWGDQSVSCLVDPRHPAELGQEIDVGRVRSTSAKK